MCSLRTGVVHTVYRQAHVQPYIVNRLCVVHEVCFKHGVVPLLVRLGGMSRALSMLVVIWTDDFTETWEV